MIFDGFREKRFELIFESKFHTSSKNDLRRKMSKQRRKGRTHRRVESLAAEYLDRKLNTELARMKMSKQDRGQEMQ